MAIKKNINNNLKIPNLFLFFAIFSSAIVLIIIGIHTYKVMEDVLENSERSQIIRGHIDNIRLFDEVLTSSALLAASTGNAKWEKRYRIFEPKLDSAINKLLRMDPLQQTLKIIDNANIRLVAMENSVFELVRDRKLNEAVTIMTGSEYARQKAIYSEGLSTFIKLYELETARQQTQLYNAANRHNWFLGLVILFLAIVWLSIERFLRKSRTQILKQNQELELQIQARKESESTLQESKKQIEKTREQLHESIKASNVGLWEWNMQTNTVYQSPEFKEQIGYNDDEIQSSKEFYFSHLHPEDAIILNELSQQQLVGEIDKFDQEYRFRHKDGSYRWMMSHTSLEHDQYGKPMRMFGSHIDITERKNSELKIDELKTNLELILNSVGEGIYGLDNKGNITFVNKAFEAIIGCKSEEIIGKPMHPLIHHTKPDGSPYPEEQCPICLTIKEGKIFKNDNEYFFKKDGSGFFIEYVSTPIVKNNKVDGAVILFKDITDRLKDEVKINLLAHAIKNSADCITITDKDHKIIFVNDSFCKVFGYAEEEIVGQPIAFITSENNLPEIEHALFSALEKKEKWTGEVLNKRKDGNNFPGQLSLAPLLNDKGEFLAVIGVARDITERKHSEEEIKKTNEELIKINAEKDKFFSIISHDLRSPFSGLLGLTQIMAEELPDLTMAEIQSIAVRMRNSATNLFSLLENLLLWARMQQGLVPFNPEVIQIHKIVHESIVMMVEPANIKGIEIVNDIPVDLNVFADSNVLQNVIRNLVSNAVKFTHKGGKISLSAKATADKNIEISITDSGIGISNAMIENLFRLDIQTNRKGTEGEASSGLGLLLCKEFIEKHGGKIWVESEEGKGSTFHFVIPSNQY